MNKMYVYVSYFNYSTDKITKLLTVLFGSHYGTLLELLIGKY